MVSPGAGPVVAVAVAPPAPLKETSIGPVQPLPGLVMVTPVTLYVALVRPADGDVLTTAVGALEQPLIETVGGEVYEPPLVTWTKATRVAEAVAVSLKTRFGLAVMVTTALALRAVGL